MAVKMPLTEEDKSFVIEYLKTGDKKNSFKTAYGDDVEYKGLDADYILARSAVKKFTEEAKKTGTDLAKTIIKEQMLMGNDSTKSKNAQIFVKLFGEQEKSGDVFTCWSELMRKAGAEIVVPPHDKPVTLTFESFLRGEAHINFPLAAKLRLLEIAGAPWNDRDPNAKISNIQREALTREDRELLILGASGIGKSSLGGMFGVLELMLPNRNTAVISQYYKHVGNEFEYVTKGMKTLFGALSTSAMPIMKCISQQKYQDYHISTLWGSEMKGYSASEQEGALILGSGFDLVICGEADLIPYDVYNRKILRSMDRRAMRTGPGYRTGRSVLFTTPAFGEGAASSIYCRVMEQTNDKPEKAAYPNVPWAESIWIRSGNVLENPSYDRKIYESRKKMLETEDPDAFAEQYEGQIRKRSGAVLKEFDREKHVVEMPSIAELKQMRFGIGIDPGSKFAAVLIGMTRERKYYVLAEVYNEKCTVRDNINDLKEIFAEVLAPVLGVRLSNSVETDWSKVKYLVEENIVIDKASEQKLELEEEIGETLYYSQLDVPGTLSSLRQMIAEGKFVVVDSCNRFIKDAVRYVYKPANKAHGNESYNPRTGEIRKQYDHLLDATRYIIFGCMKFLDPTEDVKTQLTFEEAVNKHYMKQMHDEAWGINQVQRNHLYD